MAESAGTLEPNSSTNTVTAAATPTSANHCYKSQSFINKPQQSKMGVACRPVVTSSTAESSSVTGERPSRPSLQNFDIFANEDYEAIEDWLDEHPQFVHSYFTRKASRTLIDSWLMAHSSNSAILAAAPSGNFIFASGQTGEFKFSNNSWTMFIFHFKPIFFSLTFPYFSFHLPDTPSGRFFLENFI